MWKKLRDGHRQALNKKKTTTGQAASSDRLWKYEKQMEFLVPHLCNRQRSTNAAATQDITPADPDETESIQEGENPELIATNNETQQVTYDTPRPKRKIDRLTDYFEKEQKRRDQRSRERDLLRQELLDREKSVKPKEDTALKKFFDSMCDLTSNMPEFLQIKVQRQIFNSVMEAQEAKLQNRYESPNSDFPTQYRTLASLPCPSNSSVSSCVTNYEVRPSSTLHPTVSQIQESSSSVDQYTQNSYVFSPGTNANHSEVLRNYLTDPTTYTDM